MAEPSCPSAGSGGSSCLEEKAVELTTGRELLIFALLLLSIVAVMWALARTRRSPR
jgi:hypothetical protein